jgi:hypothetical protein
MKTKRFMIRATIVCGILLALDVTLYIIGVTA